MFIKVFVPNANGKIELSVQELEALLKDAAAKAVSEKCANCNRGYWYNYRGSNSIIHTYPNITVSGTTESNIMDNVAYLNGSVSGADLAISYNKKTDPSYLTHITGTVLTNNKGE